MLIVEDGTGIEGAESYVSVSDLDAYHLRMGNTDWPQPPEPTPEDPTPVDPNLQKKEANARKSALFLDAYYGYQVDGIKKNPDQGLIFPRLGAHYWDGSPINSNSVPSVYKNAQCEVARLSYTGVALAPTIPAGQQELIRKKIDVLEWEWSEGTQDNQAYFGWLDVLLAPLFGPPEEDGIMQIARIIRS